jgi:CheY-like chemotaxis protein
MRTDNLTRLLVVEDNVDDTFLLTRQLARAQIDDCVTVIGNGTDALEFLLNTSPAPLAVFLDLSLPGMSGIDLLKQIKREPRLREVPVIIMTGSLNPIDLAECNKLGIKAYLSKPVSLTTFIKTVAHLFPKVEATS